MAEVLVTKFEELDVPAFTEYKCVGNGNDIYIISKSLGIYKYDGINKVFTLLYATPIKYYNSAFVYDNKIYYCSSGYATTDSRNYWLRAIFSAYDLSTNTNNANVFSIESGKYNHGLDLQYVGTVLATEVIGDKVIIEGFCGITYSANRDFDWTYYPRMIYNLTTNKKENEYYNTSINYLKNSRFFYGVTIKNPNLNLTNVPVYGICTVDSFTQHNFDYNLLGSTFFVKNEKYFILGGKNATKQVLTYDAQTNNFNVETLVLPEELINLDVGYYNNGNDNYVVFYPNGIYTFSFIDYDLTYSIKDQKGDTTYKELLNNAPITSVRFNYQIGGENVGYNIATLSSSLVGTYKTQIPDGYTLAGFSDVPNSTSVKFPLNTDVALSVDTNFTFYEVYQKYRPVTDYFEIMLYKCSKDSKVIDKTSGLTLITTLQGALRDVTSMLSFDIVVEYGQVPTFNYAYIPSFNRYYFIDDIVSVNNNMWELLMSVDVLMTYKTAIKALPAFIDRSESNYDRFVIDNNLPMKQGEVIETTFVTNELFVKDSGNGTYVLQGLAVAVGDAVTGEA